MHYMFYGCSSLASLDVSGWDTSEVTYVSDMFSGCSSLREVSLGPATRVELPAPSGGDVSGRWVSSVNGVAYRPSDVPAGVAATYTAQPRRIRGVGPEQPGELRLDDRGGRRAGDLAPAGMRLGRALRPGGLRESVLPLRRRGGLGAHRPRGQGVRVLVRPVLGPLVRRDDGPLRPRCLVDGGHVRHVLRPARPWPPSTSPAGDTSNVTDMSGMFSGCSSLASLDLSGWDTSNGHGHVRHVLRLLVPGLPRRLRLGHLQGDPHAGYVLRLLVTDLPRSLLV